jgi:acyl carrier protein
VPLTERHTKSTRTGATARHTVSEIDRKAIAVTDTAQTQLTAEQIDRLRDIVVDVLELEPEELTETSLFIEDHGADSLLAIEILARIEQEFTVSIPQEKLGEMTNLAGVCTVVARSSMGGLDV